MLQRRSARSPPRNPSGGSRWPALFFDSLRRLLPGLWRGCFPFVEDLFQDTSTAPDARCYCLSVRDLKRRIDRDAIRPNELRDAAFRRVILSIPKGSIATYGQVAAAAGYPLYHRAVARLLRTVPTGSLPWQRVVGAGGEIKLPGTAGAEQRLRLELEGVTFRGKRANLQAHAHAFRTWE